MSFDPSKKSPERFVSGLEAIKNPEWIRKSTRGAISLNYNAG